MPKNYVNNKDLYEALIVHRNNRLAAEAAGEEPPRIPKYIGECIFLIATNLASKGNFCGYSFREEMVSDGLQNCIKYMNNFNPEKTTNPFGYFSRILWNAYILRILEEREQTYVKYKALEEAALFSEIQSAYANSPTEIKINDNMKAFVHDFETRLSNKKNKIKVEMKPLLQEGEVYEG